MLFWLTLGHFCCSGVMSVKFSSNLNNFFENAKTYKRNPIFFNPKYQKKTSNIQRNPKSLRKSQDKSQTKSIKTNKNMKNFKNYQQF